MSEVPSIFVTVTVSAVVGFGTALVFVLRAYPVVRKFLAYSPQSYSYMKAAWFLISSSILTLFTALVFNEFGIIYMYKVLELLSAIIFLSAFSLLFQGFRRFRASLGVLKVYLKRNIGNYNIILVLAKSTINTPRVIGEISNQCIADGRRIILGLGPTAPSYFSSELLENCIWLARSKPQNLKMVQLVGDSNPTEFNLKFSDMVAKTGPKSTLIGDFLDTYLRMLKPDMLNTFWSDFVGKIRSSTINGIFFVSEDLHPQETIAFLRRYAEVVMEVAPISEQSPEKTYIRIRNFVDDVTTGWIRLK